MHDLLQSIESVRTLWVGNLEELETKIPHNDIVLEQKTYSFHVVRNAWLAHLNELDQLEREIRHLN
jgi:hypothetical protein